MYEFLPDFGEEASGLFTDFYRILGRRFPDCLRIVPDFWEDASELFTDFYRILGRRLPDCLRIFTGFWEGGFRIVYGFVPDFGEEAAGFPSGIIR